MKCIHIVVLAITAALLLVVCHTVCAKKPVIVRPTPRHHVIVKNVTIQKHQRSAAPAVASARKQTPPVKTHRNTQSPRSLASRCEIPPIGERMMVEATAYCLCRNRTATGTRPRVGVIAVDPRVIPLGSTVYVEGYGVARAEDTGRAIKGRRIDIWLPTRNECLQWGRRRVIVYLIAKPE